MGYKMKGAGPFEIAKARSGRNQPDRLLSGRAALPVFANRPRSRKTNTGCIAAGFFRMDVYRTPLTKEK